MEGIYRIADNRVTGGPLLPTSPWPLFWRYQPSAHICSRRTIKRTAHELSEPELFGINLPRNTRSVDLSSGSRQRQPWDVTPTKTSVSRGNLVGDLGTSFISASSN